MGRSNTYGKQRKLMRELFEKYAGSPTKICGEYAEADRRGLVPHKSNRNKVPPEKYAIALLYDGIKRGWLRKPPKALDV
jgi:hypothetical protein